MDPDHLDADILQINVDPDHLEADSIAEKCGSYQEKICRLTLKK